MSACQRRDGFGPCHREGEHPITVGCRHEHVRTVQVCQPCFDITAKNDQGCVPCYEAGHWCRLHVLASDRGSAAVAVLLAVCLLLGLAGLAVTTP